MYRIFEQYPVLLQRRIASLAKSGIISESSYVLVECISGADPSAFYQSRLIFEESKNLSEWPNIILLDFSVSIAPEWAGALHLDILTRKLKKKWGSNDAEGPSFLILNLFSVSSFYSVGQAAFNSQIFYANSDNLLLGRTNRTENIKKYLKYRFWLSHFS